MSLALAGHTKRVTRRVAVTMHHGPVVLTLAAEGIYLRQKGRRKSFLLPYGAAFLHAVNLAVAAERAARKSKTTKTTHTRGR